MLAAVMITYHMSAGCQNTRPKSIDHPAKPEVLPLTVRQGSRSGNMVAGQPDNKAQNGAGVQDILGEVTSWQM
jgi:hypothetical protein